MTVKSGPMRIEEWRAYQLVKYTIVECLLLFPAHVKRLKKLGSAGRMEKRRSVTDLVIVLEAFPVPVKLL